MFELKTPLLIVVVFFTLSGCHTLPDPHELYAQIEATEKLHKCEEKRLKRRKEIAACFIQWREKMSPSGHNWTVLAVLLGIGKAIDNEEEGALAFIPYYRGREKAMHNYVNFCLAANGNDMLPYNLKKADEDAIPKVTNKLQSCPEEKKSDCPESPVCCACLPVENASR